MGQMDGDPNALTPTAGRGASSRSAFSTPWKWLALLGIGTAAALLAWRAVAPSEKPASKPAVVAAVAPDRPTPKDPGLPTSKDPPPKDQGLPPPKDLGLPPPKDLGLPTPKELGWPTPKELAPTSGKPLFDTSDEPVVAPNSPMGRAFALVYPGVVTLTPAHYESVQVKFRPVMLYRLNDRTLVLLSVGRVIGEDLCHVCSGFYSIAYLSVRPTLKLQGAPFVGEGSAGGWWQPPELKLLKNLGPRPIVLVRSSYVTMGDYSEWATLVELGATRSRVFIVAEDLGLYFGNGGDGRHCVIEGTIRPRIPGKSFVLRYRGSFRRDFIYRRSGNLYKAPPGAPGADVSGYCPPEPGARPAK